MSHSKPFSQFKIKDLKDLETGFKNITEEIQDSGGHTFLFIGELENQSEIEKLIPKYFKGAVSVCTTAGEISCGDFENNSLVGCHLHGDSFYSESFVLDLDYLNSEDNIIKLKEKIDSIKDRFKDHKFFATLLIDGLAMKEESSLHQLEKCLGSTPLVGGSAGDNLEFKSTYIFDGDRFKTRVFNLTLFATKTTFQIFDSHYFRATEKRLVITEALPSIRRVNEINGIPAASAYAEAVGIQVDEITNQIVSTRPVMVNMGGDYFVRSIRQVNDDGSLDFFCAIEKGLVLRLGERSSIEDHLQGLDKLLNDKPFELIGCLFFECILRRLDILKMGSRNTPFFEAYRKWNACGFHTYGESLDSIHVNQTLTGIAFYSPTEKQEDDKDDSLDKVGKENKDE